MQLYRSGSSIESSFFSSKSKRKINKKRNWAKEKVRTTQAQQARRKPSAVSHFGSKAVLTASAISVLMETC
jgi:hypothetical protein